MKERRARGVRDINRIMDFNGDGDISRVNSLSTGIDLPAIVLSSHKLIIKLKTTTLDRACNQSHTRAYQYLLYIYMYIIIIYIHHRSRWACMHARIIKLYI